MDSKNRKINLEYSICKEKMSSDTLKRHWLTKHKNFDFKVTTVVRGFLKETDGEHSSNEDLELEIVSNGKLLDEKIALGEKISKLPTKTNTKEESLSRKEAFDLYQSRKLAIKPDNEIQLYPWQLQMMNRIQESTLGEVILVKGACGNEGKHGFKSMYKAC